MSLSTGLVSYWKFDESSGNAADSVASNTLTNVNTTTFVTGKLNNAANLVAASSQYFTASDHSSLRFGAPFTLSTWVNSSALTGSQQTILSKFDGTLEFELSYETSSGKFRARLFDVSVNTVDLYNTSAVLALSTWYNVVVTNDGTTMTIRTNDGTVDSSSSSGLGTIGGTSGVWIGQSNYLGGGSFPFYWNGKIDEIGKWNRVLTGSEITQLYNGGAGISYPFSSDLTVDLTGVSASPAIGTFQVNGSFEVVGVAASPVIGVGMVEIAGTVVEPPVEDLVPSRWFGLPEDERVYLTGVTANPQVGVITAVGKVTPEEFAEMYRFPRQVEDRPLPRLVPRKKAPAVEPPKPDTFVYMTGVHPMPKVGTVTTKAFYEDVDEELIGILELIA